MSPPVLLINLGLSFAAMAALCLSLDRHYRAAFLVSPGRRRARALRIAGWAGLAASFAVAVLGDGWNFGPVQWIGAMSGAALLVAAVMSYGPTWLRPAALVAVPLAVVAALLV